MLAVGKPSQPDWAWRYAVWLVWLAWLRPVSYAVDYLE